MGTLSAKGFWYPIKNYQGVFGSLIEIIKGFLVPYKKLPRVFWEPNLNHQGVFGQVSFFGPRGFWTRGFWEWFLNGHLRTLTNIMLLFSDICRYLNGLRWGWHDLPKSTQIYPNLTRFTQIYPNLTQIYPNLTQIYPYLPKSYPNIPHTRYRIKKNTTMI